MQTDKQATIAVLKAAREAAGISGRELSRKLGRPYNYVHLIETGQRELSFLGFLDYARKLDEEPAELVERITRRRR